MRNTCHRFWESKVKNMEIPVYLFTGLLESGKTTLIHEVAGEEDFLEPGTTLLIQCEEGENSYSQEFLEKYEMVLIKIENQEDLNREFWEQCELDYSPAQIMIEYNGMWEMDALFESGMPQDWALGGIYSTVNGATAELYLANMRKMFMEPLQDSNLIIFNRCSESIDRQKYRRNFKAFNPQVQVVFERENGTLYENEQDVMPFDYTGQRVIIDDMDYGLWYLDAMDHPEHYLGKTIHFNARYCESADPGRQCFVPGRHVMTCCEDDIQFLGFACFFDKKPNFSHGQWVSIDVKFDYGPCDLYGDGEEGPMLYLESITEGMQPEQELVTFT